MNTPGISVIIPTQGRPTLERLLDTVEAQGLKPDDQVLVVVDTFEMDADAIAALNDRLRHRTKVRFLLCDAGYHDYGHAQLNAGLERVAPGNYITFNDDDDVYTPDAFAAIRDAMARDVVEGEPRLHIFKFVTHWGQVLPDGPYLANSRVGGHCLVVPNLPGKVGRFTSAYDGDWFMIADTAERWGDRIVFEEEVIARCRP